MKRLTILPILYFLTLCSCRGGKKVDTMLSLGDKVRQLVLSEAKTGQQYNFKVMSTKKATSLFVLSLWMLCYCRSNKKEEPPLSFEEKIQQVVLSENKVGQEYFCKVGLKGSVEEYRVTYIGNIKNKEKGLLKILNTITFSGYYEDSKRANANVFIYDGNNKEIGWYYVGGVGDTPSAIEGTNLVFSINEDCDLPTTISLADSIPKEIFVNCTAAGGNMYGFSETGSGYK